MLAVGDMEFQKKCLGKMEEVSSELGRTVLFVSHQLPMIESLCHRCLLMDGGNLALDDATAVAVARHRGINAAIFENDFTQDMLKPGSKVRLIKAWLSDKANVSQGEFTLRDPIYIHMEYEILEDLDGPLVPNFHFADPQGKCLCVDNMPNIQHGKQGRYHACCVIPGHTFNIGQVCVGTALTEYNKLGFIVRAWEQAALVITIKEDIFSNSDRYGYGGVMPGPFRIQFSWSGGSIND